MVASLASTQKVPVRVGSLAPNFHSSSSKIVICCITSIMARNSNMDAARQWHRQQKNLRIELYNQNPKCCQVCETTISYEQHKTKKFCSHSCAAIHNNMQRGHKVDGSYIKQRRKCARCGLNISSLKYCSSKCRKAYAREIIVEKWLNGHNIAGEYLPVAIRSYLLEKANNCCSKCEWNEMHPITKKVPLEIDHIDGNPRNNIPENLRVLCPNCHSLTPSYGALNKGHGRQKRYKK